MRIEHTRRGSGAPLVLLHGVGDSRRVWSPVLAALARERECWALDLPGFGRSPMLRGAEPSPAAQAVAVREFMAAQGVETFHVAGNSMGGGIAFELARLGAARSVCALSPIGFGEGWERAFLRASLRASRRTAELLRPRVDRMPMPALVRRALTVQLVHRGERIPPEDLRAGLTDLALSPAFGDAVALTAAYRFTGALDVPVTVAWGEHDRLMLYRPQAARARERLPGARHITLTRCGHLPTWDDPDQVARVILGASAP